MKIDYKKLLTAVLRPTRWGELVDVYQSIVEEDIKPDLVESIMNQYNFDEMTNAEKIKLASIFGFNLLRYEGYTSSDEYLDKQVRTIFKRTYSKTLRKAYKYLFYVYNGTGDVFPTILKNDEYYEPAEDWWTIGENPDVIEYLDAGDDAEFEDTTLDDIENFVTLDQEGFIEFLTRYILLSYKPLMVENSTQFLSTYSLLVFQNDAYQIKKITEQLIYEPYLVITAKNDNNQNIISYINYEGDETAYQKTILLTSGAAVTSGQAFEFGEIGFINFGTGGYENVSGASDVETFSFQLTSGEFQEIEDDDFPNSVLLRKTISSFVYGSKYSEIAVFDLNSGCILYSTFPTVEFHTEKIYGNLKFQFAFE